jgi:hypothetical protein
MVVLGIAIAQSQPRRCVDVRGGGQARSTVPPRAFGPAQLREQRLTHDTNNAAMIAPPRRGFQSAARCTACLPWPFRHQVQPLLGHPSADSAQNGAPDVADNDPSPLAPTDANVGDGDETTWCLRRPQAGFERSTRVQESGSSVYRERCPALRPPFTLSMTL